MSDDEPRNVAELYEVLADIEHQRWSAWQAWVHECGTVMPDGALLIDADHVGRWARQMGTPYAELSEQEKQSDRDQVDRYWMTFITFVARWLAEKEQQEALDDASYPDDLAGQWLDETSVR